MSAIVSGILNSTVGLLCSKLQDYAADRLNEGDLTDDQCRQIIVRELDDIKSKLDGLSRKDLLAGLSFFKEGVTRLYMSLEMSGEFCDEPGTSIATIQDKAEVEGATAATKVEQIPPTQTERDVLDKVLELSKAIGNLKITSKDRYEKAKKSFREAQRLATEAFNNVALSTEERIMAGKLRIASSILEGLDDLEAAVGDCLLYLKELQDLPAIRAMFSVWRDSQKGITSRLRARFNKEKRNDNIQSIQLINALLCDLTVKFAKTPMALFSWPTIMIGTPSYHPLLEDPEIVRKIENEEAALPCIWKFNEAIGAKRCVLTSKGEILSVTGKGLVITRRSGECDTFWLIPSEKDEKIHDEILCVAVDDNDNVYILIKAKTRCNNYKLLILDANGNAKAERFIEVISQSWPKQINVTKDGMVVIVAASTLYIFDSTNTKPDYKLPLPFENRTSYNLSFTVSDNNEIIFIEYFKYRAYECEQPKFFNMYISTMYGELNQLVRVPCKSTNRRARFFGVNVVVNHVNDTILVSYYENLVSFRAKNGNLQTTIFTFSKTGELLDQFKIQGKYPRLKSHPNGPVALVKDNGAILLQM